MSVEPPNITWHDADESSANYDLYSTSLYEYIANYYSYLLHGLVKFIFICFRFWQIPTLNMRTLESLI